MRKHPVTISLQGCLELFLDQCESRNLSPATIQFYVGNIGRFIRYLTDEQNLECPLVTDFKVEYIREYLKQVKNGRKWENHSQIKTRNEKVGSQSVRTYTRALRAFGNWLFTEGFIKENVLELVKLPQASDKVIEVLKDTEIEAIFQTFDLRTELGLRNGIIFMLATDVGIREGGIANLRISDVDLKEKTIRVRLKGGNTTILPIGNTLTRDIRKYIAKYRDLRKIEEPLFVSRDGKKLTENAIKKMFSELKQKSGIERVNCHLCRHTFATNYVSDGKHTQKELQLALAHESDTMSKEYVHLAERVTYVKQGADSHFDKMEENRKGKKGPLNRLAVCANIVSHEK